MKNSGGTSNAIWAIGLLLGLPVSVSLYHFKPTLFHLGTDAIASGRGVDCRHEADGALVEIPPEADGVALAAQMRGWSKNTETGLKTSTNLFD